VPEHVQGRLDRNRVDRHAERVRTALLRHAGWEPPVRPVLIFLTGTLIPEVTIKQMPDVLVLDRMDVPRQFKKAPRRLTDEQVEQLYDVARRPTTWL